MISTSQISISTDLRMHAQNLMLWIRGIAMIKLLSGAIRCFPMIPDHDESYVNHSTKIESRVSWSGVDELVVVVINFVKRSSCALVSCCIILASI